MYILFWHFVSEDRHSFLNNNVSHSSGLFTFTKRKEHFRTVYIKFWKNSFDSLTWETTFNFAYIIQERPSVIFGGWERAGIEMKLCSNGIQKKKSIRLLKMNLGYNFQLQLGLATSNRPLFLDWIAILLSDFPFNELLLFHFWNKNLLQF